MDIVNAHAVIVGASKGAGAGISRALAAAGARLTLMARPSAELDRIASETGGTAQAIDLTDLDGLDGAIAKVEAANGPVDILVCNAALANAGPFSQLSAADLRRGVHANMLAHMELCRQAVQGMLARRRGTLMICGSASTEVTQVHLANYTPAKAGLTKFGIDLQGELKDTGIAVFVLIIGSIRGTQLSNAGLQDPIIRYADKRFGNFGAVTPEMIGRRVVALIGSRRRSAVETIPRLLAPLSKLRLLPLRLMDPLMLWPVQAEIRRARRLNPGELKP